MIEWHPNDEILLEWARNDGMTMWWMGYWLWMTEWWWNEMNLRIKGFALVQEYHIILHHSVIPHHSWMTKLLWKKWKWLEWLFNDISPLWFSFLVILNILKWHRNGGMRRNGGVLEGKIKTEFWDTCHSWVIQVILLSFHNLYAIPRHSVISFILAPRVYYYPRPPLGAMPKIYIASPAHYSHLCVIWVIFCHS